MNDNVSLDTRLLSAADRANTLYRSFQECREPGDARAMVIEYDNLREEARSLYDASHRKAHDVDRQPDPSDCRACWENATGMPMDLYGRSFHAFGAR
jgi:hypothetical protein